MTAAGGSNIGLRKDNEDRYHIDDQHKVFIIADGMGGHEHGQLASRLAVANLADSILQAGDQSLRLDTLEELFQQTNDVIYQLQQELNNGIIGTTLTAVIVQQEQMLIGHIGDSRLYLLRDDDMIQLTLDHSYYAELMRLGQFEQAQGEQKRNVLLKALGPEKSIEGQYLEESIYPQDILLLCTDGLYNALTMEEIQQLVLAQEDLEQAVQLLLDAALERGASDNLTVVLYRHEGEVRP